MDRAPEPPVDIARLANQLAVLAKPIRLQILNLLIEGIQCNCDLSDMLGIAPNLISHHVRVLRQAGLVFAERDRTDARWVYYVPNREAFVELHQLFGTFFDPERIKPRRHLCSPASRRARKEAQTP